MQKGCELRYDPEGDRSSRSLRRGAQSPYFKGLRSLSRGNQPSQVKFSRNTVPRPSFYCSFS